MNLNPERQLATVEDILKDRENEMKVRKSQLHTKN